MPKSIAYLNALRAFEAASKTQSFAKAGLDLNVSHGVVSKHIKNLEAWLEVSLFTRHGNRVELTDEGRVLAPRISEAFKIIQDSCDSIRATPRSKVINITAEPAFAYRWLRKQLADFKTQFPNIDINLKSAWSPPDINEGSVDICIHFEQLLKSSEVTLTRLFSFEGFPACSPSFFKKNRLEEQGITADLPLVHESGRDIWRSWFEEYEPNNDAWKRGTVYSDLSLALDAAVDGEGVVLADDVLCARELVEGALIIMDDRRLFCDWYSIVTSQKASSKSEVGNFLFWLTEKFSDIQLGK